MNFDGAIPTEQVMPSWLSTFDRIAAAISRPVPNNRLAPVTSKRLHQLKLVQRLE